MAKVVFTTNLERLIDCPPRVVRADTVAQALDSAFAGNRLLADYIFDDQKRLRKNVAIFVDGNLIVDRTGLSDAVGSDSEIYVMQALSGG